MNYFAGSTLLLLGGLLLILCSCSDADYSAKHVRCLDGKVLHLMRGAISTSPSKRNLREVGEASPVLSQAVRAYLAGGIVQKYSYVASELYIQARDSVNSDTCTFGFVINNVDGKLIGIDVTGGDSSRALITGSHVLIYNSDEAIEETILREIDPLLRQNQIGSAASPVAGI